MKIQLFTLFLNALLDPLFIFGFGAFPAYGTLGAAYATLLCRILTVVLSFYFFKKKTPQYFPRKSDLVPRWDYLKRILKISIPASISHSSLSFGFLILQGFVNSYGTAVISINSIGNRLLNFFTMPSMGLSSGLAAIVGQNLGANNLHRVKKSIFYSVSVVLVIMITGGVLMYAYGAELTKLFISDPEVVEIGNRMFKVTALGAFFFAVLAVLMGVFNGSGHTAPAMVLNITRLWIFRVPLVFILSGKLLDLPMFEGARINGLLHRLAIPLSNTPYDSLWWSMLYSNILTLIMAVFILKRGKWETKEI
jgi:putative MATE family efflux protein